MQFDPLSYAYGSRRNCVYAQNGVVATSHPLAAQVGLEVMQKGGNAIDAAVATAASLTLMEPTSNGIGGDAFALIWSGGRLYGLNASGYAPQGISRAVLTGKGFDTIPPFGWEAVTVPGAPAAWAELWKKFGKLPFPALFERTIEYAEAGIPILPTVGYFWEAAFNRYKTVLTEKRYQHWFETFAPRGKAPGIGSFWNSPSHGDTLRKIAETEGESFYRGELAKKIARFSSETGGYFTEEDLARYGCQWVEPISVNYKGYDVWEIPPNGQGLVALMALNMLKKDTFSQREDGKTFHLQIEAIKSAFADAKQYVADPRFMPLSYQQLIADAYSSQRRSLISDFAQDPAPGEPDKGGTVYLATADREGNMVSYIQSNYMGFGSGLVVPGTGIALQNRGHNFSFDADHPNCIGPGKKPYHTIIPGFITKQGKALGPFGVMGGFMQPQGHLQVVMNMVDFHMNPQTALDAPRWQWVEGRKILVENDFNMDLAQALQQRGHDVQVALHPGAFGRGQIILQTEGGVFCAGTEKRCDAQIAAY